MPAAMKRHWLAMLLSLFGAFALAVVLSRLIPDRVQAAPGAPQVVAAAPMDSLKFSRLQRLRAELALTGRDLAAMGCARADAEGVLTTLSTWYDQNSGALDQAESADSQATRNLQDAVTKINVGPRDETLLSRLPALQQGVSAARLGRQQLTDSAATAISSRLTPAQALVWATARTNAIYPERYRYAANLDPGKMAALDLVIRKSGLGSPAGSDAETQALGAGAASMASAEANVQQFLNGVADAERNVLVPPAASPYAAQ